MKITVGQFLDDLKNYNREDELFFSGLNFYRLKDRGGCVQVEFNEVVFRDGNGSLIAVDHDAPQPPNQ